RTFARRASVAAITPLQRCLAWELGRFSCFASGKQRCASIHHPAYLVVRTATPEVSSSSLLLPATSLSTNQGVLIASRNGTSVIFHPYYRLVHFLQADLQEVVRRPSRSQPANKFNPMLSL